MTTDIKPTRTYRKLSPELITRLAGYIRGGNYYETSCYICDIDKSTLYLWLKQAAIDIETDTVSLEVDLFNAIKRAEAEAEAERVARIAKAGEGGSVAKRITRTNKAGVTEVEETYQVAQWLADMTHLERRHPERWGRKDRTSITIDEHKQVTITHVEIIKPAYDRGQLIEGEHRKLLSEEETESSQ